MDALLSPSRRRLLGGLGALGAIAVGGVALRPAAPPTTGARFFGRAMGGGYTVALAGPSLTPARIEAAQADVQAALDAVDHAMSLHRPASELSAFNAHPAGPVRVSPGLFEVLDTAQSVATLSDGAFDVTVAPIVRAWGFGPDPRGDVTARAAAAAARAGHDHRALRLDRANRLAIKSAALEADLGGVAKGHAVDRAALALEALDIGDYMVEAGGEVRVRGVNAQGQPWRIGIEQPDAWPRRARLAVAPGDRAMATSGDYRIFFDEAGVRFCHEINPATGAPITNGLASVTVIDDSCARADALATALIVLGPEAGWRLALRDGIAAHFIARTSQGGLRDRATPAFAGLTSA